MSHGCHEVHQSNGPLAYGDHSWLQLHWLSLALDFERQNVIGQLVAFQDFDEALWSSGLRLEPRLSLFFIYLAVFLFERPNIL